MRLALLLESCVERSDILAVRTPVDALLVGLTCEEHDAFGLLADDVVEDLLCIFDRDLDHFVADCRYLI